MVRIDKNLCNGCGLCAKDCVEQNILLQGGQAAPQKANCLLCGHCVSICPQAAVSIEEYDMAELLPYVRDSFHLNPEHFLNAVKFRRSVRQFTTAPVEREKLEKIIEAGRYTPSSTNSQDVSFVVAQGERLAELQAAAMGVLRKAQKLLQLPPARKFLPIAERYADISLADDNFLFHGAKALIVVCAKNPLNAGLASGTIELMAEAQGLAMFYVGLFTKAARYNPKIKNMLGLAKGEKAVTCLALGYPAVRYQRTGLKKKPVIRWL